MLLMILTVKKLLEHFMKKSCKLTPVPNDLAKLSNAVKNDVVKKTEYDKFVAKVNKIDTTGFVLKTTYDTDKSDLEKN